MNSIEKIALTPIGYVANERTHLEDDDWGGVVSTIQLRDDLSAELFRGLQTFSHVEVVFVFHLTSFDKKVGDSRHPRDNESFPKMGLLAQRSSYHPNPIGLSSAKILAVKDRVLTLEGLDAVDGSPVLDIKPLFKEFSPQDIKQPRWVSELLKNYWKKPE